MKYNKTSLSIIWKYLNELSSKWLTRLFEPDHSFSKYNTGIYYY